MIEVKNVVKTFDGFAALNDATLSVPTGAVYGLVGPNGAGKSTIIRHLTGIFRQNSGTVRLGGEDVWENAALKAKIAAIPDDWYYFNSAGIGDMMRFYKGFYPNFSTERYEKLREVFELDEKRPIRRFSKGMQKQAAFWLALSAMPDYLILDEPVDGLDPVMRRQVWSLMMGDVAERGTTVLVSSHNLRELEDVCDHVGIMDHGHVLLERSLAQLQDNMVKLQVVFPDGMEDVPAELPVLHASKLGRVHTLIMRMNAQEATERLMAYSPLLVDAIPLTLEEIFNLRIGRCRLCGQRHRALTALFSGKTCPGTGRCGALPPSAGPCSPWRCCWSCCTTGSGSGRLWRPDRPITLCCPTGCRLFPSCTPFCAPWRCGAIFTMPAAWG